MIFIAGRGSFERHCRQQSGLDNQIGHNLPESRRFTIGKITISELENTQNGSRHEPEIQTERVIWIIKAQGPGWTGRGVILNWTE